MIIRIMKIIRTIMIFIQLIYLCNRNSLKYPNNPIKGDILSYSKYPVQCILYGIL